MKPSIVSLLLLLVPATDLFAQRSVTCTANDFQRNAGLYSFDVWGRRTNAAGSLLVGTSQFFFMYNSAALNTPTLSNINLRYTGPADSTGDYLPMEVGIVGGRIAVTIRFIGNDQGVGLALSTGIPDGERLCTVNLTITNGTADANLSWDEINSAFTTTNLQPVTHTFIGSDESPLPITLASFTGIVINGHHVRIAWTTLSEINNYGFEVQRKREGEPQFTTIPDVFVPGHGTTNEPHHYTFADSSIVTGRWYYRLRQIDLDGTVHFSQGISINVVTGITQSALPAKFALSQNYPDPFNPVTTIQYQLPMTARVTLKIYTVLGQEVVTLADDVEAAGYKSVVWNATNVASGVYFYRIVATSGQTTFVDVRKMLVMK